MSDWNEFIADWSRKCGIAEEQLEWLILNDAYDDNRQWDRLDEIRRLGT
jgi:hypothetical protein